MPPALLAQTNVGNGHDRSAVYAIDDYSAPAKRDQVTTTSVIANQCAHWCGNPHLSGPGGAGRRTAPQGLRIATGFALAMTVVDGGWTVCFVCVVVQADRRGQCRPPYWHKPM